MPEKSTPSAMFSIRGVTTEVCTAWDWTRQKLAILAATKGLRIGFFELDENCESDAGDIDLAVIHLQNRSLPPLKQLAARLQANSKAQVLVMLDDWLQGFRRTLPQGIHAFYWYETYGIWRQFRSESTIATEAIHANGPVFCFGNDAAARHSLVKALNAMGCSCVALECCTTLPSGEPALVIWLADFDGNQTESEQNFLRRLQIAYPDCTKFRVTEFPSFESAAYYLNNGIDFEIGTPYDLSAVLETASLFSSAALRRK